ncbi:MAG: hypothetical protein JWQ77_2866 [Jatrophihabitans sp.]|nr:hypothetical protein [Jatrophihabitans sp.]
MLPRTYLTGPGLSERDRCAAALAFAGEGAALSGAAALRASEVSRVPEPRRILVLVPPENRTGSSGWVQVRATRRRIVTERWTGPRRVEVARSAADYALELRRLDDVRALVARVVSAGRCTLAELREELEAGPRNGSAQLRQVLREVGNSRSGPEAKAATILRRHGLAGFVQNARIDLPGAGYYETDFLWRELRAILEVDSIEHHFEVKDWRSTMDRHLVLTTLGYSVVHRPPSALRDELAFAADIRRWLAGRRAELG